MSLLDGLFNFPAKKRKAAQGFPNQQAARKPKIQAFILEKMRTPSGIVDGLDDVPDPAMIEPPLSYFPDVDIPEASDGADGTVPDLGADGDFDSAPEAAGTESVLAVNESLESLVDNASEISTVEIDDVPFIENDNFAEDGLIGTVEPESASEVISESVTDGAAEVGITARESEDVPFAEGDEITKSEPVGEAERSEVLTEGESTEGEPVPEEELSEGEPTEGDEVDDNADEDLIPTAVADLEPVFESGVFTVGDNGQVSIDFLFDGGAYNGELAIFSLDGMDEFAPGSEGFIQEAARRALSDSELGHVVISDSTEGARFSGILGTTDSEDYNVGEYTGSKTVSMSPGGTFGFMLVPNGTVQQVFDNPNADGAVRPLFSLVTANPDDAFHVGQLVDVFGDSTTFVMEDLRVDTGSDRDYNDIIFRVDGAKGYAALLDEAIAPGNEWRYSELGQRVLAYVNEFDNSGKDVPGDPTYPGLPTPELPIPTVPSTPVDQGGNGFSDLTGVTDGTVEQNQGGALPNTPTLIEASATGDLIDQVSSIDTIDFYQVSSTQLVETEISVLSGNTSISMLTPEGEVLTQQVLTRGTHSLTMPEDIPGEVLLKFENQGGSDATYILRGFESQAKEPFNIDVEFGSELTASQKETIQAAAKSVESLIGQGLPSAIVDGKIIDDVNFKISVTDLDGADGALARTKIDFMRYGTLLPAQSITQFDVADIAQLESSGQLFSVVQHEILHGLGFGNLWEAKGLVDYAGTPFAQYTGENAIAAFQELGGVTDYINLETEGDGSANLHWHEGLFQNELMTRDLGFQTAEDSQVFSPISTVTLAALADLGYQVNLNRATPSWGLLGGPPIQEDDIPEEVQQEFEQLVAEAVLQNPGSDVPIIVPAVEPSTIAPEIWAHAERFDLNGEYYDWELVTIQDGDTVSEYVLDRMTHPTKLDNRDPGVRANDPAYWQFIVDRNIALGVEDPNVIIAGKQIWLPVWNENYEQEQEEERKRREEELKKKLEEEKKERERLEEIYRQSGSGGLEWWLAKPFPDFSGTAPYETVVQDVVGSLVPDDYFRFTLSRPGYITIYLEDLLADADLYLYDSRNRLIAKAERDGVTDEKIILNLTAGTYLVRVHSSDGLATDYSLKVRFDGLPSRTQIGTRGGGKPPGATFANPQIERIFKKARDKFAAAERAKAQSQIDSLEAQKKQYQQELEALLAQAVAEQKAKIQNALDGVRNDVQNKVSNKANDLKSFINGLADGGINAVNSLVPDWLKDKLDWLGLSDSVRNAQDNLREAINSAKNSLNGQIDWVRDRINDAIWQFIEMVKNAYLTGAEINQAIENAANWLKGKTDELVNFLNDKIGEFKGWILGKIDWTRNIRTPDWARNLGVPYWNLYEHHVVGLVDGLANSAIDTVSAAGDFFKDTINSVKPLAQGAVAVIVDAIFGDKTGYLYNQINGIDQQITAIRNGVEKAISDQTAVYKGLLDNFINGLGEAKDFIVGALMGEFNNDASIWQVLLDTAIGMIPLVGEIGDVRDLIAFIAKFTNDPAEMQDFWNWVGVVGAGLGLIPVVGGALKGVTKLARNADLIQEIRKLAAPVVDAIIDFARKADWSALTKQTSDFFDKILGTVEGILIKLNESISNFSNLIPQLGLQLQPEIGKLPDEGFFADMADRVRELRRTAPKKIEEGFAFFKGKLDELAASSAKVLSGSPPFSGEDIKKFFNATEEEVVGSYPKSHLKKEHIATGDSSKDMQNLINQVTTQGKSKASMFHNEDIAANEIAEVINKHYTDIENFAKNPNIPAGQNLVFTERALTPDPGFGIDSAQNPLPKPMTKVFVNIKKRGDGTWLIQTAFPKP